MIINYRKDDLMFAEEKYILHGCNAQGVMGKGVAKSIREHYPEAYDVYREHFLTRGLIVGSTILVPTKGKIIINAISQRNYAKGYHDTTRYVSYDAIEEIFKGLNFTLRGETIAIPKIGSQLGGGNWDIISNIIDVSTPDINIVVYYL